jgi:hypothetical protein
MAAAKGLTLVLHDTTEFTFQRERSEAIGKKRVLPSCRIGRQPITKCVLLMHSSLALTTQGKPLRLTAVKFWTRKKFKGTDALAGRGKEGGKHSVNATRILCSSRNSPVMAAASAKRPPLSARDAPDNWPQPAPAHAVAPISPRNSRQLSHSSRRS